MLGWEIMGIYIIYMQAEQPPSKKEIKSVKQICDDLKQAKQEFDILINCLSIPSLTVEEDLEKRSPTIEMILKDLPSEQRLKEMLEHPYGQSSEMRQRVIAGYKGKYDIIHKAASNIKNLKPESEKLYYLAAEINIYKITNELEANKQEIKLKTYEVSNNQSLRVTRHQKNTISPTYIRDLKTEELRGTTHTNTSDYLNLGEPLLHLNLYDSISGEKVFQYVCYGEQTLLEVVSKFYCLITRLEGRDHSQHINSYCLIEQNFYYQGPSAKKKIEQIVTFSSQALSDQYNRQPERPTLLFQMSKTKLKNLRVVFGRPYLYRHLDGCDHIIIFKDLRILTENQATDPTKKDKYPLVVFEARMRRRKCEGCKIKFSEWVSLNDPLKAGKHLYLCSQCHRDIHSSASTNTYTFIRYIHD